MDKKVYDYISKLTNEKILDWMDCRWCSATFPVFEKEKKYLIQNNLPNCDLCLDCRFRNLLMWRNEKTLYWRKSDISGKKILSAYSQELDKKVYDTDEWEQEGGFHHISKNYNTEDEFINLYYGLLTKVPAPGTDLFWNNDNIWYCNRVGNVKNAYYSFCCFQNCEDIYFSYNIAESKDVYNASFISNSSLVYDSVRIFESHHIFFCDDMYNSRNIYFSFDLRDCEACIFCNNLVGKKYMIYNKQYEKGEFEKIQEKLSCNISNYEKLQELLRNFEDLKKKAIRKGIINIGSEKCIGDQLTHSNNTLFGYGLDGADDCFNSSGGFPASQKKVYNSYGFGCVENLYFSMGNGPLTNGFFSVNIENSSDIYFSQKLKGCHHCIGCYGLQNADYHILNTAYSKEAYEIQFKEIMEKLGKNGDLKRFYNPEQSPYPLNDSHIMQEFPIQTVRYVQSYHGGDYKKYDYKEMIFDTSGNGTLYVLDEKKDISDAIFDLGGKEIIRTKWRNKKKEIDIPDEIKIGNYKDLPSNISEIHADIIKKGILCEESKRPFRIIQKELDFYKKYNIALPHLHPDMRLHHRNTRKSKIGLFLVNCNQCGKETLSVYDGGIGYNVYCEACYNREIY